MLCGAIFILIIVVVIVCVAAAVVVVIGAVGGGGCNVDGWLWDVIILVVKYVEAWNVDQWGRGGQEA